MLWMVVMSTGVAMFMWMVMVMIVAMIRTAVAAA